MKKIIISCFILLILASCTQEKSNPYENKEIQSIQYDYGSYHSGYYFYSLIRQEDGIHFFAEGKNGIELDIDTILSPVVLEELKSLLLNSTLAQWNGYNARDNGILDGFHFSLTITFDDGSALTAYGYAKYPKDFEENSSILQDFFSNIVNRIDE